MSGKSGAFPEVTTLPQHFKNHGYYTQAFGKIYHGVFPEGSSKTVADTYGDPISWSVPAYRPGPRYYYAENGIAAAKEAFQAMYRPVDPHPSEWTEKLVFGPMTEAPDVPDETLYDGLVAKRATETLRELETKQTNLDDRPEPMSLPRYMKVKRMGITEILRRILLFSAMNLLVNKQLNSSSN